jgi:hypothetical protein
VHKQFCLQNFKFSKQELELNPVRYQHFVAVLEPMADESLETVEVVMTTEFSYEFPSSSGEEGQDEGSEQEQEQDFETDSLQRHQAEQQQPSLSPLNGTEFSQEVSESRAKVVTGQDEV